MSIRRFPGAPLIALAMAATFCLLTPQSLRAGFRVVERAIGGIVISSDGALKHLEQGDAQNLQRLRQEKLKEVPEGMQRGAKLRKLSLRRLQDAIRDHHKDNIAPLPDHIRYLAGLQSVRYVFVYPEQKDIVLAGPAESWKVNATGDVVGVTTGKPVLHLDDLLVGLRIGMAKRAEPVTCSIDPTAEGSRRVEAFFKKQKTIGDPRRTLAEIERQMGPQDVSLTGVPDHSRFARVLVAADYRLKRLAMGHDRAPVRGMPSFIKMVSSGRVGNLMPRWWLADDYKPVRTDGKGLAYEIRGGIKAMTEDDKLAADGSRVSSGKVNPIAKKWADSMTTNYDAIAEKQPIFAHLRNCMDLAVVGALLRRENLPNKAGLDISYLLDERELLTDRYNPPKHIATMVRGFEKGRKWVITISGGVSVDPWSITKKQEVSEEVAPVRKDSTPAADAAWWY